MYTPKFCYIDKDHGITVRELKMVLYMYTIKFWYIDKDHEITVRELKIVITHVYTKILIYWHRS